jgi:hypothetical protein
MNTPISTLISDLAKAIVQKMEEFPLTRATTEDEVYIVLDILQLENTVAVIMMELLKITPND